MPVETERKFLIADPSWKNGVRRSVHFRQGYFPLAPDSRTTIRVRLADQTAWLTIKGPASGCSRMEYEYEIPQQDADELLSGPAAARSLEKIRHYIPAGPYVWEIDEFLGRNRGLVVAEIELPAEDAVFERPAWLGKEVTDLPRFRNSSLTLHPWTEWSELEKTI